MTTFIRCLIFLLLFSNYAYGQNRSTTEILAFRYIDSLFAKEKYIVEYLDVEYSPEMQDILLRMQKAMADNKEWTEQYLSRNYKPGEGLPYHENLGVTKEEYEKIKNVGNATIVVVKKVASVSVNRTAGLLTFKSGNDGSKVFDRVEIDMGKNLLMFNSDTIPFHDEVHAPGTTPFGEWNGYGWKMEVSNLGEKDDLKFDKLVSKIIQVYIGKVKKSDKILFRVVYKEIDRGQVIANVEIVCNLF